MRRLIVPILAAAAALAQQPSPAVSIERQASERAKELLASPLYLEKAWGAYLAGKYRLQNRAEDLLTQIAAIRDLADSNLREDTPEFAAIQATLDALIQLGQRVDSGTLAPFFPRYPNEVLILFARDPSANGEALLALAQEDLGDLQWAAIYNLLVQVRSPGVGARLLGAVRIHHVFHITDGVHFRGSGGGSGGSVLCGAFAPAPGFPPAAFYELVESPQTGDVMLAGGRHPVYYRRTTVPSAHSTAHDRRLQLLDRDSYRMEYLADLSLLKPEAVREALSAETSIVWSDAVGYRREVSAAISAQQQAIENLIAGLRASNALGAEDASAMHLTIKIETDDQRAGGEPVPELEPVAVSYGSNN